MMFALRPHYLILTSMVPLVVSAGCTNEPGDCLSEQDCPNDNQFCLGDYTYIGDDYSFIGQCRATCDSDTVVGNGSSGAGCRHDSDCSSNDCDNDLPSASCTCVGGGTGGTGGTGGAGGSGGTNGSCVDFTGTWTGTYECVYRTTGCGDSFGGEITIEVMQTGCSATYTDGNAAYEGDVSGNVFEFHEISNPPTETGTLTLDSANAAHKESMFTLPGGCEGDCQDELSR